MQSSTIYCGLMLVMCLLMAACGQDSRRSTAIVTVDPGSSILGGSLGLGNSTLSDTVKPLDDPSNPYAYEAWDQWLFDNRIGPGDCVGLDGNILSGLPDGIMLITEVEADGRLVPALEHERRLQEAMVAGRSAEFRDTPRTLAVAIGPMNARLLEDYTTAHWDLTASYMPKVPAWLLDPSPPTSAKLLPDGRVITLGEPGDDSLANLEPNQNIIKGQRSHLYSPDGELIGTSSSCLSLILTDAPEDFSEARRLGWDNIYGHPETVLWGYFEFRNRAGEFLFAYDHDGVRYDSRSELTPRDEHYYGWVSAGRLLRTFEAQQSN